MRFVATGTALVLLIAMTGAAAIMGARMNDTSSETDEASAADGAAGSSSSGDSGSECFADGSSSGGSVSAESEPTRRTQTDAPGDDGSAVASAAPEPCAIEDPVTDLTLDMLDELEGEGIKVFAFRADADLRFVFSEEEDVSDVKAVGNSLCDVSTTITPAPVDAMLDVIAGKKVAEPEADWGGGMSRSTAGSGPGIRILDTSLDQGTTTYGFGGHGENAGSLAAGEWLLYQGGIHGLDAKSLGEDDVWTLHMIADGPMTLKELPDAEFRCGYGFQELESGPISAPYLPVSGSVSVPTNFGGLAIIEDPFGPQTQIQQGTGIVSVPGMTASFAPTDCIDMQGWGKGEVKIQVTAWTGTTPMWAIAGIWTGTQASSCQAY